MDTIQIGNKDLPPEKVVELAASAANWFRTIGAFSVINALPGAFQTQVVFVVGLGATMMVDAFLVGVRTSAEGANLLVLGAIGYAVEVAIISSVFVVWYFSRRGMVAAYVIGAVLYSLDSLIMVAIQDWVGLAFHGFFMLCIWAGLPSVRARKRAEAMIAARQAVVPPELPVAS